MMLAFKENPSSSFISAYENLHSFLFFKKLKEGIFSAMAQGLERNKVCSNANPLHHYSTESGGGNLWKKKNP